MQAVRGKDLAEDEEGRHCSVGGDIVRFVRWDFEGGGGADLFLNTMS